MGRLFVRTATAGTGPDIFLEDLGYTVETGVSWQELSATVSGIPLAGDGQFTPTQILDSRDLYEKITTSGLEWSSDGVDVAAPSVYNSSYLLVENIYETFIEADDVATKLDLLVDEDGAYTYIGEAAPGALTTNQVWRLFRLDETLASEELIKRYANGDAGFVHRWSTRTSQSY